MADECICYVELQVGGLLSYQHAVLGIVAGMEVFDMEWDKWCGMRMFRSVWHGTGQLVWNGGGWHRIIHMRQRFT